MANFTAEQYDTLQEMLKVITEARQTSERLSESWAKVIANPIGPHTTHLTSPITPMTPSQSPQNPDPPDLLLVDPEAAKMVDTRTQSLIDVDKQLAETHTTQLEQLQKQSEESTASRAEIDERFMDIKNMRADPLPRESSVTLISYPTPTKPPDPPDISKSEQNLASKAIDPPNFTKSDLIYVVKAAPGKTKASTRKLLRRCSCEQVYERMDNGLCVFCEEQDTPGHYNLKHRRSKLCLVESVGDESPDDEKPCEVTAEEISNKSVNMIQDGESNPENESRPEFSHQVLLSQVQHTPTNQYRAPFSPCQNHSDKPHNKGKFGNCIGHEIESDRDSDEIEDDELQDKQIEQAAETLVMNEDEKPLECNDEKNAVTSSILCDYNMVCDGKAVLETEKKIEVSDDYEIVSLDKESDLVIVEEIVVASVLKFPTTFTCMRVLGRYKIRKTYILIDPGDAASGNNIQTGHKCGDLENWSLRSEDDFYKIKNQQQQVNNREVIIRLVIPVIVKRAVKREKDYDGALLAPLDDTVAFSGLDVQQLCKQQLDTLLKLVRVTVVPFSTLILMTCIVLELIKDKASKKRKLCKNWWFKYKLNTWLSEALHFWRKRKYEKLQRASDYMMCELIYKVRTACHCVVRETNQTSSHVWYGWKTKAEVVLTISIPIMHLKITSCIGGMRKWLTFFGGDVVKRKHWLVNYLLSFKNPESNRQRGTVYDAENMRLLDTKDGINNVVVIGEISHFHVTGFSTTGQELLLVKEIYKMWYKEDSWLFMQIMLKGLCASGFEMGTWTVKKSLEWTNKLTIAISLAQMLLVHVCKLQSTPQDMLSDRDPTFLIELFRVLRADLSSDTTYEFIFGQPHPVHFPFRLEEMLLAVVMDRNFQKKEELIPMSKVHLSQGQNKAATKALVQWKEHPPDQATWEFYQDLVAKYPDYSALRTSLFSTGEYCNRIYSVPHLSIIANQ